jgi:hypothetical protein
LADRRHNGSYKLCENVVGFRNQTPTRELAHTLILGFQRIAELLNNKEKKLRKHINLIYILSTRLRSKTPRNKK